MLGGCVGAALLGLVTYCANNHVVHETGPDGTSVRRVLRDSAPISWRMRLAKRAAKRAAAEAATELEDSRKRVRT